LKLLDVREIRHTNTSRVARRAWIETMKASRLRPRILTVARRATRVD